MHPSDQHIRDQVIQDSSNQLILAGAGSGKTTLIVDKYIHLIKNGVNPAKIVAITFTNKSADELKLRIAKKYKESFPEQPPLPISLLPISTIHGFCNRIIQDHAFDFGYLPSYEVEQDHIQERIHEYYSSFLPTLIQKYPKLMIWNLLGWISFHHIYTWLCDLHDKKISTFINDIDRFPEFEGSTRKLKECIGLCSSENDQLFKKINHWINFIQKMDPQKPLTWSVVMNEKIPSVARLGNQTNWESKENLLKARDAFSNLLTEIINLQKYFSSQIIEDLHFLHQQAIDGYAQYKKELQIIEPDDLLHHVQKLLYKKEIWESLIQKIDYIFVDEFQDTDPLQAEIIIKLLAKNFPDTTHWKDIEIHPKLTVVGDPQQSIYRFRNASIETFFDTKSLIEKQGGKTYTIVQNFRSDSPIIDFVNQHFGTMNHFSSLVSKNEQHNSVVNIIEPDTSSQVSSVSEARSMEAKLIADHFHHFFAQQSVLKPKDCVLLLPTFSHVETYEKALSEHFDTLKQRKSSHLHPFFSSILTLLTYLQDPSALHFQHLLRTPFFFHSLEALHPLVVEEKLSLEHLVDTSERSTIKLLLSLYEQSPYFCMDVLLSCVRGDISEEELHIFRWTLEKMAQHESEHLELNLIEYLQDRFVQSIMPIPLTDQTIRIMTIHQSKGLEFPIVALGGLYSQAFQGQSSYTDPSTTSTEISFPPFSNWLYTPGFEALKAQEKITHLEEKQRLLYVACTRAKHHLIAAKIDVQSRQKTFADLLWPHEKT